MKFFDEYFVFSSSEKRGIYLFLLLIFLLCLVYLAIPHFMKPDKTDFSELINTLEKNKAQEKTQISKISLFNFNPNTISKDSLELLGFTSKQAWNTINFREKVKPFETKKDLRKLYAMTDSLYQSIEPYIWIEKKNIGKPSKKKEKVEKVNLFEFNLNTITKDSLVLLGFKPKIAETIIKFRTSKGGFETKEDLKNTYGVTESLYQKVEPYIRLSEKQKKTNKEEISDPINLNTATQEDLMKAKGIGATFSKRIIEYRELLGGFAEVEQLTEVYGIDEEWIEKYAFQFEVNRKEILQIPINSIGFKELLKHPYFSFSEVKRIINYREMHGSFESVNQIRDNNLIKPKQYRKIAPYLSLN